MRVRARLRLALLGAALVGACERPAPSTPDERPAPAVVVSDRYVVRQSARAFPETLSALFEALDRRDLTVFAVVDHAAAAQGAGLELPPTTLVLFGDPEVGTPLMVAVPLVGEELPLRALVYERDGEVFLAVTGIANLSRRYALGEEQDVLDRTGRMLAEVADEVTRP